MYLSGVPVLGFLKMTYYCFTYLGLTRAAALPRSIIRIPLSSFGECAIPSANFVWFESRKGWINMSN